MRAVSMRSLRAKVLVGIAVVATISVVLTAWLVTRSTSVALRANVERSVAEDQLIVDRLNTFSISHGSWQGVATVVRALGSSTGRRIVVTDAHRRVLADSDQLLGRSPRRLPDRPVAELNGIQIITGGVFSVAGSAGGDGGDEPAISESLAVPVGGPAGGGCPASGPCMVISGSESGVGSGGPETSSGSGPVPGASLTATPAPPALLFLGAGPEAVFGLRAEQLGRTAGLLAVVVGLAALGAWWSSRRLTGPVRAVASAAGAFAAGDHTMRVDEQGSDEIGQLSRSFNAMADAVASTEAARRQMVADIAHELRNPLNTLQGTLEAIEDGLEPMDEVAIARLGGDVRHLSRIVSDLAQLAAGDAGQLKLHCEPVALGPLLDEVVARHRPLASPAVEISASSADVAVAADRARLRQILDNLTTNAVRHTSAGGMVHLAATMGPHGGARIDVIDSGEGIPPEHLGAVFDRFYRVDSARGRQTGGSGLGLAVVRQLVEAHGGSVTVRSAVGQGSCFTVQLPLAARTTPTSLCAGAASVSLTAELPPELEVGG